MHQALPRAAILLFLCASGTPSKAQSGAVPAGPDTLYRVQGTVVNSLTAKPIGRALVSSQDHRLATMTDGEGHFAFDVSVPARPETQAQTNGLSSGVRSYMIAGGGVGMRVFSYGGLALQAQRPQYLSPEMPVFLPLDDTLSAQRVVLKLTPAASIAGRVLATTTDSPHNVRIVLLMHQVQEGERVWVQTATRTTNTRGEFLFGDLHPGEYTLMTMEWRGDQPQPEERLATRLEYPPVFYGDAPELSTAAMVHLKSGEPARLEMHLHQASYYPVTVPVATTDGQRGNVNVLVTGGGPVSGYQLGYNRRDQAVEGWLPSGNYSLVLTSYSQTQSFAALQLHVANGPVEAGGIALAPSRNVPVRINVAIQSNHPDEHTNVHLSLRPEDGTNGFLSGSNQGGTSDEFELKNVQPGRYTTMAQPSRGYVAAMTSGGVDLTQNPLVVGASGTADPVEVTVRDDGGTVSGKVVAPAGTPPRNSFLFLLPMDTTSRFSQGYAAPDGSYTMSNIAPGSYRLLALDNQRVQIPYRDAVAMRAYTGKGVAVTVSSAQQARVDVPLLDESELPQ